MFYLLPKLWKTIDILSSNCNSLSLTLHFIHKPMFNFNFSVFIYKKPASMKFIFNYSWQYEHESGPYLNSTSMDWAIFVFLITVNFPISALNGFLYILYWSSIEKWVFFLQWVFYYYFEKENTATCSSSIIQHLDIFITVNMSRCRMIELEHSVDY